MSLLPSQITPNQQTIPSPETFHFKLSRPIPKLQDILSCKLPLLFQQKPLLDRIALIQNPQLPAPLKSKFIDSILKLMQPEITQRLKNAKTIDDSLEILRMIKSLCSSKIEGQDELVYSSDRFHLYFKPFMNEAQKGENSFLTYNDFQKLRRHHKKDPALTEILCHWFVCVISHQEEFNWALKKGSAVKNIYIRYAVDDAGATLLAKALKRNQTLITLEIFSKKLGNAAAASLAEALTTNQTLTSLDLSDNNIGAVGATALAKALKANKTLTNLNLHKNKIGNESATALAEALTVNQTLTSLDLSDNNIAAAGATALAEALKVNHTLTSLHLIIKDSIIGNAGTKALAKALKVNKMLTSLDLELKNVGDEGARSLAKALAVNQTLTSLRLHGQDFEDASAKSLAEALKVNKTLLSLNLRWNCMKDGAAMFAEALTVNQTLTSLDLGGNYMGDVTAELFAVALTVNQTLTSLDLRHNMITPDVIKKLKQFEARVILN